MLQNLIKSFSRPLNMRSHFAIRHWFSIGEPTLKIATFHSKIRYTKMFQVYVIFLFQGNRNYRHDTDFFWHYTLFTGDVGLKYKDCVPKSILMAFMSSEISWLVTVVFWKIKYLFVKYFTFYDYSITNPYVYINCFTYATDRKSTNKRTSLTLRKDSDGIIHTTNIETEFSRFQNNILWVHNLWWGISVPYALDGCILCSWYVNQPPTWDVWGTWPRLFQEG